MITFIPLSGFLGAGKTTTMIAAARALESDGRRVSVVTNDQGTELVDTALVRSSLAGSALPVAELVGEITGGCFCCRFDDLMQMVTTLIEQHGADTVIAEAVGSCTDLRATVVRPLRALYGDRFTVTPLTTVVDPLRYQALSPGGDSDLAYLFDHQLAEADVLALNKVDIAPPALVTRVAADLSQRYPNATVVPYSALTGEGLGLLLETWASRTSQDREVDIDYDRYAAAEAGLAWLNRVYDLAGTAGAPVEPDTWAMRVLAELSEQCAEARFVVGHAKVTVQPAGGHGSLAKASLTAAGAQPYLDVAAGVRAERARAVLNARVACPPEDLDAVVAHAVEAASRKAGSTVEPAGGEPAFRPSYPRPVHRMNVS